MIVFLSRAPTRKNVLVLFPILPEHLIADKLLLHFHEYINTDSNFGKQFKVENEQIISEGIDILGERCKDYSVHFVVANEAVKKLIYCR